MIYEKYILSDHPDKEESPDDSRKDGRKKGKRNTLEQAPNGQANSLVLNITNEAYYG